MADDIHQQIMANSYIPAPYPPGCHFVPTNSELIIHYLKRKVDKLPIPIDDIHEVNLYKYHPRTLTEKYPRVGQHEWYFFTPRQRKYQNGSRPNRAAGDGYWKATTSDKCIYLEGGDTKKPIGYRKTLVYCEGKHPDGVKTNWTMHEFTPDPSLLVGTSNMNPDDRMRLDDWVLCRVYKKAETSESRKQRRNTEELETSENRKQRRNTEEVETSENRKQPRNTEEVETCENRKQRRNTEEEVETSKNRKQRRNTEEEVAPVENIVDEESDWRVHMLADSLTPPDLESIFSSDNQVPRTDENLQTSSGNGAGNQFGQNNPGAGVE